MEDLMTSNIIPVNCAFCGEEGEVFAGTLADDEDYVCDACYEMYLQTRGVVQDDRQTDSKDAVVESGREAGAGI